MLSEIREIKMSFYLTDDIFKKIMLKRRELMRDDLYKHNYNKVMKELLQIDNIISHYISYDNDDDFHEKYRYKHFKNDFMKEDYYDLFKSVNDYYENKISYDDFKEATYNALEEGFYFYDDAVNLSSRIIFFYDNYVKQYQHIEPSVLNSSQVLISVYKKNKHNIYLIMKKLFQYRRDNDIDDMRKIFSCKDYNDFFN